MFNNKVSTTVQVHRFSKRSFYLFCNSKLIKNGRAILIKRNDICFFRSNSLNVSSCILENISIINNDLIEIFIQQVTKNTGGFCLLT